MPDCTGAQTSSTSREVMFTAIDKTQLQNEPAAVLLVFVDCLKELPATLILRPFNFETLATNVYQFASDELIEQAALGALMIVVTGLLPVILLNRTISTSRTRRSHA